LTDVRTLRNDFPSLPIVCLHRIPDDQLWVDALEAGASDVCQADDPQNVLSSILHSVEIAKSAVA
jgi:DNA-binding NarL/FixJ family response regulator